VGDEDDVCIICQTAFEGVAPGVKFPGDECPVVVRMCCVIFCHFFCDILAAFMPTDLFLITRLTHDA